MLSGLNVKKLKTEGRHERHQRGAVQQEIGRLGKLQSIRGGVALKSLICEDFYGLESFE